MHRITSTLAGLMGLALVPAAANANTFVVDSTVDAVDANPGDCVCSTAARHGNCTLRAAVMESNECGDGGHVIELPNDWYELTIPGYGGDHEGDLDIHADVEIRGVPYATIDGDDLLEIDNDFSANDRADRIFDISAGARVTLSKLDLFGGGAAIDSPQGGLVRNHGHLTIANSMLRATPASVGGAVANLGGDVVIRNTDFLGNSARQGGAIYSTGVLVPMPVTRSGDRFAAPGPVWDLVLAPATVFVTGTLFDTNWVEGSGGAIFNGESSSLEVVDSAFRENFADYWEDVVVGSYTLEESFAGFPWQPGLGGAVYNEGTFVGRMIEFEENIAQDAGGAVASMVGPDGVDPIARIFRSTFDDNEVFYGVGGALAHQGPALLVENSTFVGNRLSGDMEYGHGGVVLHLSAGTSAGTALLHHITADYNWGNDGAEMMPVLMADGQWVRLVSSVVAETAYGQPANYCEGDILAAGVNYFAEVIGLEEWYADSFHDPDCGVGSDDLWGPYPFGAYESTGTWGMTTLVPAADSMLIGAATVGCLDNDQAGAPRFVPCDLGAIEIP